MADLHFEGCLDGTSEVQLNYIRNVLENLGYKNEKVIFEAVGKASDNYVANVKRIVVEKDGQTIKMIAKISPTIEAMRVMTNTPIMFQNEHYMYTKVLPKISEMLISADVPEAERLRYATCYGTFMEAPNEIILLEDLAEADFQMLDRFKPLSSETIKLVLKSFAILHSASFALKQKEPETYEEFDRNLQNIFLMMQESNPMIELFQMFEEDALTILDEEKYKKLLKGSFSQMGENIIKNANIDSKSRYSVILQGDPWTNNIMFRLEGDKALECCMIDYQGSRSGSPVGDIHYMIFNCSDYETRAKHFNEWIDYYYSELDKNLANFGLKAHYIYSRERLDTDMRRYAKLSFNIATMMSGMMVMESEAAAKMMSAMENETPLDIVMEQTKVSSFNDETILRYKKRITGVMDSFLELGFLVVCKHHHVLLSLKRTNGLLFSHFT